MNLKVQQLQQYLNYRYMESENNKVLLRYWNIRGLAQRVRIALEYFQIPYDQAHYEEKEHQKWFDQDKPLIDHAFVNLPLLKDGDTYIFQSDAILQYIALKANKPQFLGRDNKQKIDVAMVRGVLSDFQNTYYELVYDSKNYETDRPVYLQKFRVYLSKFSKFLGEKQFMCGDITYIDFILADILQILSIFEFGLLEKFDNLRRYLDRLWDIPQLKSYRNTKWKEHPINGQEAHWR